MKTSALFVTAALGAATLSALALCPAARAQNSGDPGPAAFQNFKMTRTRNIFDPDRRPLFVPIDPNPRPRTFGRPPRENSITLTGMMVTEGKKLAFFAGTRSEYNKVIGVNDKVADFTVKDITSSEVKLELGGKPIAPVSPGQKLPLNGSAAAKEEATMPGPDEAPPDAVAASGADNNGSPSASAGEGGAPSSAAPAAAPTGDASQNDVLRRMMERRAKGQ